MAKYSQKEAVYAAIAAFMAENGRPFDESEKVDLSSEDRKTITTMLVHSIDSGDVDFSAEARVKYDTPEKIRNYATGLLSNWLRKDTRLNGGNKHSIKNPGSRIGQDDPVVKDLKAIRRLLSLKSEQEIVDKEIRRRVEFLQNERSKKINVNTASIPEHLRHLVG